jgi:hypothetical protein
MRKELVNAAVIRMVGKYLGPRSSGDTGASRLVIEKFTNKWYELVFVAVTDKVNSLLKAEFREF